MQDAAALKAKIGSFTETQLYEFAGRPPFHITFWIILLPLQNLVTLHSAPALRFMTMDL